MTCMTVVAASARAMATVASVTAVAAVVCEMHRMILREALKQLRIVWIIDRRRCRVRQRHLKGIWPEQAGRDEARDQELLGDHNGMTFVPASSSGCHSKKPEHRSFSLQFEQSGWYLRFQSEIDAGARSR